jgi:hypothetical protein
VLNSCRLHASFYFGAGEQASSKASSEEARSWAINDDGSVCGHSDDISWPFSCFNMLGGHLREVVSRTDSAKKGVTAT